MKPYLRYLSGMLAPIIFLYALGQPALAAPVELSLDDSIAMALKNNPAIKITAFEREKAYWVLKQAKAGKGVTLAYTHSDQRYNTPPNSYSPVYTWTTKYDNELSLSLPIYSGGKLESQISRAGLSLKVADLDIDATRQQLKQTVTSNYFNVLQCRNNLQISRQTVDNYNGHLKNVQIQFDAGTVAKSDVLASEVSLANAMNSLIKAENNYHLAIATLNNTVGLPLNSETVLREDLKYEPYLLTIEDCAKYALSNRPEISQYQAKVAIADEDVTIARSSYLPTVKFVATQDWYNKDFPGADNSNWLVGLAVSLNLFDSGLTRSQLKQAQQSLGVAREQNRQERDTILLEIRQYYLSLREAEKRIETSKVAVNQAEDHLRIAEIRYTAGVGTNLDVLDAVLSLNTAKTNQTQALYDYNTNKAQLAKSMGMAVK